MRAIRRSTFGLVAIVGLVLALATLAVGAIAYSVTHEALEVQLDHRIAVETRALIDEGNYSPSGVAGAIRRRDAARSTASLDYLLIGHDGVRLAGRLEARSPTRLGYQEFLRFQRGDQRHVAQALTTRIRNGETLVVAADRAAIHEMDATLKRLFLGAFGTMLLLGLGAAWLVGSVTRSRLARIDRAAQAIIAGDLDRRMPVTASGDEFDRVSATLNQMLDRIAILMGNLRQVSSDVAHDLRTPLTRLHNRLEEASLSTDPHVRIAALAFASEQSRDLLDIFASLLRIAEVEALTPRADFKRIALSELVDELIETYRPDFEASDHPVHADIAPDISIGGDRRLLQQMITNLFDNALRHTPAGTNVRVSLGSRGAAVRLTVADDGPGVAPGETERLFQRFARGESSRSSTGHGLGLALVAAIAHAHGGKAQIVNGPGFTLVLELPRKPVADAGSPAET